MLILSSITLRAHNLSISTASEPCLNLRVDIKPFSEATDWDATSNTSQRSSETSSLQQSIDVGHKYVQTMQTRLPGLIMNHVRNFFYKNSQHFFLYDLALNRWKKHFQWFHVH